MTPDETVKVRVFYDDLQNMTNVSTPSRRDPVMVDLGELERRVRELDRHDPRWARAMRALTDAHEAALRVEDALSGVPNADAINKMRVVRIG